MPPVDTAPAVRLQISATPAQVRTARLVAVAVARRRGVDEDDLDEIRLAVGEACSRAVNLHRSHAPAELVTVRLDGVGEFVVTVCDLAPAAAGAGSDGALDGVDAWDLDDDQPLPAGVGLAIIGGLVDDLTLSPGPAGRGTIVRMTWPLGPLAAPATASVVGPVT